MGFAIGIVPVNFYKVVGIVKGGVVYTKIVNNESRWDEAGAAFPKTGNNVAFLISSWYECCSRIQEVMSKTASLWNSVHAVNASTVYQSIWGDVFVELFQYDFFQDVTD